MSAVVDPSFVPAALAILVALAWKATIVLGLALGISRLLTRGSAALRHGVWTLAVAALLALPIAQTVAPPLSATLPFGGVPSVARMLERAQAPPPRTARSGEPTSERSGNTTKGEPSAAEAPATGPTQPRFARTWPMLAVLAWLAGALAVLTFFGAGGLSLARVARRARPLENRAWRAVAVEVARGLGVRRPLRFLVADFPTSPMTWGLLEPTILLPSGAAGWSTAQFRSFLVHELAHVARRDCTTQEWAHVACALYWFHPGAWFAAHRMRVEREQACDDLVLADGANAEAYAGQLLDVVRAGRVPRGALSGAAMASPSQLEARVRALLDGKRDRGEIRPGRAVMACGLALLLIMPLAAVVPATTSTSRPTALSRGELAERWQRALREGIPEHRGKAFWFAYAIKFNGGHDGQETLLSDSEGWNKNDLKNHGVRLADRLGSSQGDAVLLFRVPAGGSARRPGFDRVALRSARLSPDLGGLPVVAVGFVPLDESLDWLLARLDETPEDRRAAVLVTALALHDTPRTEPLLEEILGGTRADMVRVQAAEGMERHPGAPALAALVAHTRNDVSQDVRRESAEAVGDLAYPPATEALIDLVREIDDDLVRAEAVESLGAREPERVLSVLVSVANGDASEMVRREAVETLGDLPDNAGLQTLRRMAQGHRDPAVRSEAVETLNEMGLRAEQAARSR